MITQKSYAERKWLRTKEVREVYGISSALLLSLSREEKIIRRKISGSVFYQVRSLEKLLK